MCEAIATALDDPLELIDRAGLDVAVNDIAGFADRATRLAALVRAREAAHAGPLVAKGLEIEVDVAALG